MRRRLLVVLTIVMMTIIFTGCSEAEKNESNPSVQLDSNEGNNDFSFQMETLYVVSDIFIKVTVYRNTVTDVLYLWEWSGNRGGLTEMSDPETGLPLTYERYMELYKKSKPLFKEVCQVS